MQMVFFSVPFSVRPSETRRSSASVGYVRTAPPAPLRRDPQLHRTCCGHSSEPSWPLLPPARWVGWFAAFSIQDVFSDKSISEILKNCLQILLLMQISATS